MKKDEKRLLENIGKRLREIRSDKRLSQKELALNMGIIPNQYSKVETGKVVPSIKTLIKAASVLEVSLDEIVFGSSSAQVKQNVIADEAMAKRIDSINKLSGDDKAIAIQLLDLIIIKQRFKDLVADLPNLKK